jgi:hypothetical protein
MGKCTAKTQKGRRCKANAVGRTKRCIFHRGKKKVKRNYDPDAAARAAWDRRGW